VVRKSAPGGDVWSFDGRRFEGVTFDRVKDGFLWLRFRDCEFVECSFDRCSGDLRFGSTTPDPEAASRFERCVFTGCDLSRMHLREARFEDCEFAQCRWELHLRSADLLRNKVRR